MIWDHKSVSDFPKETHPKGAFLWENPNPNPEYCFLTIGFCFPIIHRTHLILGGLHESSPWVISGAGQLRLHALVRFTNLATATSVSV